MRKNLNDILAVVLLSSALCMAAIRDLSREDAIKASIVSHNSAKQVFNDNVEKIITRVAIPLITEANRLEAQAAAIRAEVASYLNDSGITAENAETYLNLIDNKLDTASFENKSRAVKFLKDVVLLTAPEVSDIAISDPNIIGS